MNCSSVRASPTTGPSWTAVAASGRHLVAGEAPGLGGLDDEHALDHPLLDQRDAQEGVVGVLAGLAEVLEPRMLGGVLDHDRPELLGHEARQALVHPHPHPADALGAEADRRRQHQVRPVGLDQVDRADVGLEPLLDQLDDVGQRLRRLPFLGDQAADLVRRQERRARKCSMGVMTRCTPRSGAIQTGGEVRWKTTDYLIGTASDRASNRRTRSIRPDASLGIFDEKAGPMPIAPAPLDDPGFRVRRPSCEPDLPGLTF